MKDQIKQLKEELRDQRFITKNSYTNERAVRRAISELRKEGVIFIPTDETGVYVRIDYATSDLVSRYLHSQIESVKTQLKNTMLPLREYVKDQKLEKLIGRLEGVIRE